MYITAVCWALMLAGLLSQQPAPSSTATTPLDFEVFRTKIQPIFLAKRLPHLRLRLRPSSF